MRRSRRPLVIASRKSLLARAQAQGVGKAIAQMRPGVSIRYMLIESEGDTLTDAPLGESGGKGLFTRAIERVLLESEADMAVHSLKDLPANPAASLGGLEIAATPSREDVRDCLVSTSGAASIKDLPKGAVVGTASPRRAAQALRLRPDLRIKLIRGNIETRLRKVLEEKQFDATFLAIAGLRRAGLAQHAVHPLDVEEMLPAACQGALALQCRAGDHVTLARCLPLNDAGTGAAVHAERQIVAGLEGDCHAPIGVLAQPTAAGVRLRIRVLSADGQTCLEFDEEAPAKTLGKLVKRALASLLKRGAKGVLKG